MATTLQVYGVAAVPNSPDSDFGHLVIITEVGIMNTLQLYQQEEVPAYVTFDLWGRLAAGVCCMHGKRIIHQDLKPENILVTGVSQFKYLNLKSHPCGDRANMQTYHLICDVFHYFSQSLL